MSAPAKTDLILLAEDDSDDRLLILEAIEDCGWQGELRCVDNGEELLDYLSRRGKYKLAVPAPRPGLILLDLNLPRKDGRQALREIRASPALRKMPVVVLTTSKADTDIANVYDLGANSFITKPVQFEDLVNVIRNLCSYWFSTVALPLED
jgi:CheY-like chemotaxis protein